MRSKLVELSSGLFRWRKSAGEQQTRDKILVLDEAMSSMNATYKDNLLIFEKVGRQENRKDKVISALFNNNVNRLR